MYSVIRIFNDKRKLFLIIIIVSVMLFDIFYKIKNIPVGGMPYNANLSVFLAFTGIGPNFHALVFWMLPISLLFIVSDDIFEDFSTGNDIVQITKIGKKKYIKTMLIKGFTISFAIIFVSLMINLIVSHILLYGVTKTFESDLFKFGSLAEVCLRKPLLTNIVFIFVASILSGTIGMTGSSMALAFGDRKKVYIASFLIWYIFFIPRKSIMLSIQPFSEYNLSDILPVYIACIATHILVTIVCVIWRTKNDDLSYKNQIVD
ncbi:MAG: hypothetical protein KBS82_07010 [Oscillospiraceae bacterium]|nr:hypothetical protein [Candidatus Limimonas egerieequi]